jgi:hypothetical protein
LDHPVDILGLGDIARDGVGMATISVNVRHGLLHRWNIYIAGDHPGPLTGEGQSNLPPYPNGASRPCD